MSVGRRWVHTKVSEGRKCTTLNLLANSSHETRVCQQQLVLTRYPVNDTLLKLLVTTIIPVWIRVARAMYFDSILWIKMVVLLSGFPLRTM
jgi:hypothetical protein